MYHLSRTRCRKMAACGAFVALAALSGCQNHKKIALVNNIAINDEEYDPAVSRVSDADLQGLSKAGVQTDAGGAGLIILVKEKLLEAIAKEKNVTISDDTVNRYIQFITRTNPSLSSALEAGTINRADLPRLVRDSLIVVAVGSNNANVPEDDVKKEFESNKQQYNYPEIVGLRAVPVPSQTEGIQLINQIKATGDFAGAAAKISPQAGIARFVPADQLPPALKTVLDGLKEGQIAPAPVEIPGQTGGPGANIVVQLVRRMAKGEATLAEAHEAARQRALQKSQPQLAQHSQEVINEYNQKANVEVYIDRYKSVVKAALTPPPTPPAGSMGGPGMGAPPSGAPGGAPGGQPMPGARRVMPGGMTPPASAPSAGGKMGGAGMTAPAGATGAAAPATKP